MIGKVVAVGGGGGLPKSIANADNIMLMITINPMMARIFSARVGPRLDFDFLPIAAIISRGLRSLLPFARPRFCLRQQPAAQTLVEHSLRAVQEPLDVWPERPHLQ